MQTSPLVGAPLARTMFKLAVPGVIGSLLFSSVGLVEATYLKHAGADALAAVAVVFPLVILAAMFSAGAMGGAISGFTARAVGAGDSDQASAVLVCAVLISLVGGLLMWWLVVQFGPLLYSYASKSETVVNAAVRYTAIVFPAMPVYWMINMLCSVMRGCGDMWRPAIVAAALLFSYAGFAAWLMPGTGDAAELDSAIRAAAIAMVCSFVATLLLTLYFIAERRQPVRFKLAAFKLQTLKGILKQGLLACSQSVMTIAYAMVTTVLFSRYGTEWLAGFGLAVRLELIMVPIIFGFGASLIAITGAYVGAGQRERGITIAWQGILINALLVGSIGLLFFLFPSLWCGLVGSDDTVIGHCNRSLKAIAPTYMFFALGLGGYFASQGLNTLKFPVIGALLRLIIVATGIYWVTSDTSVSYTLLLVALAVVAYGTFVVTALKLGPWRRT